MSAITRIYIVTHETEKRLVEATSVAQAIRHVVKPRYTAKAATPKDIAALMGSGMAIEKANDSEVSETQTTTTN